MLKIYRFYLSHCQPSNLSLPFLTRLRPTWKLGGPRSRIIGAQAKSLRPWIRNDGGMDKVCPWKGPIHRRSALSCLFLLLLLFSSLHSSFLLFFYLYIVSLLTSSHSFFSILYLNLQPGFSILSRRRYSSTTPRSVGPRERSTQSNGERHLQHRSQTRTTYNSYQRTIEIHI